MKKWNLDSVNAVLNRFQEWKASTEIDTSVDKQNYITNQALDKHMQACTTLHKMGLGYRKRIAEHGLRSFGPKRLLKQKLQVTL